MDDLIPLHLLRDGAIGRIENVVGSAAEVHRLHEMGLCGGKQIEIVRAGSPCIIRLDGKSLCFRTDDLLHVFVRPGEPA